MKRILSTVLSVVLLFFVGCSGKQNARIINEEIVNKILKENDLPYIVTNFEQCENVFSETDAEYTCWLAEKDDITNKIHKISIGYKNSVCDSLYIETMLKTVGMTEADKIMDFVCDLLEIESENVLQVVNYEIPTALNSPGFVPDGKIDLNFWAYNYHFSFRFLPAESDITDYSAEKIRLRGILVTTGYNTIEQFETERLSEIETTEHKLSEIFDAMAICLGLEWNENGGQLLEKSNFFKAAVESGYRHKTGLEFPNENGSVPINDYVRISSWYFPFNEDDVRSALENSYGYDEEMGTVPMSDGLGNMSGTQIVSIEKIESDWPTYKVIYKHGAQDLYDEENDRWNFSTYQTFEMVVKCVSDGYTFMSNKLIE